MVSFSVPGVLLASWVEKVARVRRNRPVVVFAASVYAVERLFVKKAGHIVLCRNLFHDFHCELVLVGGNVDGGEDRRKFVLSGSDFVVFGLCQNAEFPKFLVKLFHIFDHAGFDCSEIVVGKFLSLWRARSEKRASRC